MGRRLRRRAEHTPQLLPTPEAPDHQQRATGRQAVVVIHGIGEQRPMTTLRGFVPAVVDVDDEHPIYAVPDRADRTYELHTIVAPADQGSGRPQTDFYEAYWASAVQGTRLAHVLTWGRQLLFRPYEHVPSRLRPVWLGTIVSALAILALLLWVGADVVELVAGDGVSWRGAAAKLAVAGVIGWLTGWVTDSLGDAARYLDARPQNVALRQAIRTNVIDLLDALHDDGRYHRIVVVGHSLGGVIAYDALRLLWSKRMAAPIDVDDTGIVAASRNLLDAERADRPDARAGFRAAQASFASAVARHNRWLVTDLVTLGSPIAHASVLMAGFGTDLATRIRQRELPSCPPQLTDTGFSYEDADGNRKLHHAAVFAATRWTNIYMAGDFVGGPVDPTPNGPSSADTVDHGLGVGVTNVRVTAGRFARVPVVSHTRYWASDDGPGSARAQLTAALRLPGTRPPGR